MHPTIYHCTPLSPRAALEAIGVDRNFCVSFWRPDDVEAVERVASAVMFRQRRIFGMAGSNEARTRMVCPRRLVSLLRMVGTALAWQPMGSDTGCTRRAVTAQRFADDRLAFWRRTRRSGLAYGRADRSAAATMRPLPARLHSVDRSGRGQARWLSSMVRTNVGNTAALDRPLATDSPVTRSNGRARISLRQCGCEQRCAERMAI